MKTKLGAVFLVALGLLTAGVGLGAHQALSGKHPEAEEASIDPSPGEPPARTDRYGDPLPAGAVVRLGTVRLRHPYIVDRLALSSDGKTLASVGIEGVVRVWDVTTGRQTGQLGWKGPNGSCLVAVSPDGKTLGLSDQQGLRLWDVASGREIRKLQDSPHTKQIEFSPNGRLLASTANDGIRLWDVGSGREVARCQANSRGISLVMFTPDGKALFCRTADGQLVDLWDIPAGKSVRTLKGPNGQSGYAATLSPDQRALAFIEGPDTIRLWDTATGQERRSFRTHENPTSSVRFSPDGKTLFTGGNRTLALWDVESGQRLFVFEGCWGGRLALSRGGKVLAAPAGNTAIRLWDVASRRELHTERGHQGAVCQVAYAPDGKTLFTAGYDGTVRAWDPSTSREIGRLEGVDYDPRLAVSPDGKIVAAASSFPTAGPTAVRLWDVAAGKEVRRIEDFKGTIRSLAFAPNGKTLLGFNGHFGTQDLAVRFWDPATGKERLQINAPKRDFHSRAEVAFAPDGQLAASTFGDHTVRLWDPLFGREVGRLELPKQARVFYFAFAPDGRTVAIAGSTATEAGRIHLFELAAGKEVFAFDCGAVNGLAFAPDGMILAAGSHRSDVRLWSAMDGKELGKLPGHGWFSCIAFAPDGRRLATAGTDSTALVWDLAALKLRQGPAARELTAGELEKAWAELGGEDAPAAHRAGWALAGAPRQVVPFLKGRLRPVEKQEGESEERARKLIAELNDDRFAVREAAQDELAKRGPTAGPTLRRALEGDPPPEVRRRVEQLLAALGPLGELRQTGEALRTVRAIQVLERIGTEEAREVLRGLAGGRPAAPETREAKKSLARLAGRPTASP